jgi:hypothetical protein
VIYWYQEQQRYQSLISFVIFEYDNSHMAFIVVVFPLNPLTSSMGTYHNVTEWLIVAVNDNPPVGTSDMTTIAVMV